MLSALLEAHYGARLDEVTHENKRQRDALRVDDEARRRLFEMAKKYIDIPVVAHLAEAGPDYMLRLLNVLHGMEREQIATQNATLQCTVVELGRQLIEERAERRALEARLGAQEERHRAARAEDLRIRRAQMDRVHVAACMGLTQATEKNSKNPEVQAVKEHWLVHAEMARMILHSSTDP